jgi:hypothetical protein
MINDNGLSKFAFDRDFHAPQQRCDGPAEPLFHNIVKLVLCKTGMPWSWEYGALKWAKP